MTDKAICNCGHQMAIVHRGECWTHCALGHINYLFPLSLCPPCLEIVVTVELLADLLPHAQVFLDVTKLCLKCVHGMHETIRQGCERLTGGDDCSKLKRIIRAGWQIPRRKLS
jgi:hypothetical protein